jgi:hypothetical protein
MSLFRRCVWRMRRIPFSLNVSKPSLNISIVSRSMSTDQKEGELRIEPLAVSSLIDEVRVRDRMRIRFRVKIRVRVNVTINVL